ncbi:magnesium transporter [Streptococcus rifensis]
MEELLRQLIANRDVALLEQVLTTHYPVDIALALEELKDEELLKEFLTIANDEQLSDIIRESDPLLQREMVRHLSFKRTVAIFNQMPNDDVVDILGALNIDLRKQYLSLMKNSNREDLQIMLAYDPHTAGGLMTTEFITIREHLTVGQTLEKLREISPNTEVIDTLFITNSINTLVGWIDIRDLFLEDISKPLNQFMNTQLITVTPETDQEEVAQLSAKYDLSVVPVVNHRQVILGIITIDDIIDVLQEEFQEDILRMGGVSETEEIGGPFRESLKKRLPWLLVNLVTAFLASATVALFDGVIAQVVALAAISPIITGMGGNSASQTLALVIQGLAQGKLNLKEDKALVMKEIGLALTNGFVTGGVAAIVMFVFYRNVYLSLIVVLAMMINLACGAIFGYFVPLILKALKQDPALASTIFITTATDVLGYFAFLGLAQLFLPLIL